MEIDNRKEQIIKAALKRFSHFGIGKTTMNEIAEDSSISKGNIYYYFPDKNALIAEVVKELLGQFDKLIKKRLAKTKSTLEALEQVQICKVEFFEKYYMLHVFEGIDCTSGSESLKSVAVMASEFGTKLIEEIFEKGIKDGDLISFDIKEMAALYIESVRGIFMVNKDQSTKKIKIDSQLLDTIHRKQWELAKIFIKALSHH